MKEKEREGREGGRGREREGERERGGGRGREGGERECTYLSSSVQYVEYPWMRVNHRLLLISIL